MLFNNGTAATEITAAAVAITTTRREVTTSEACQLVVNLIRQLTAARGERDVYREMVSVALTQLYENNQQLERERASRYRLIEEFRVLRERGRRGPPA